jgi:ATP-dependent phosphofructokinase / diphosphate-dependent phosphofructokinase
LKKLRRIGIFTGGGDCPGLNAVIRAVVKTAIHDYGMQVLGIEDGYEGLLEKRGRPLLSDHVSGILTHGGTILGTSNTANPFHMPVTRGKKTVFRDYSKDVLMNFHDWRLDALVAVGGDGTLHSAYKLSRLGIPVVGIPKTIDNDLEATDYTFGFHSAVAIATEAVDRLHTTAASHHRVMILEVMGRNAGWIALYAGSAGGADIILLPEIPFQMRVVCDEVKRRVREGKRFSLVVVAEGAHEEGGRQVSKLDKKNPFPVKLGGIGKKLAEDIEKHTGIEARAAVLGHIQRGGSPTAFDRNLGTLFGTHAVKILAQGRYGHMVRLRGQKIEAVPLHEAIARLKKVPVDHPLVQASKSVGTNFGRRH